MIYRAAEYAHSPSRDLPPLEGENHCHQLGYAGRRAGDGVPAMTAHGPEPCDGGERATVRMTGIAGAALAAVVLTTAFAAPADAGVPPECRPLFVKADEKNDRMHRKMEEIRKLISDELEYTARGAVTGWKYGREKEGVVLYKIGFVFGSQNEMMQSVEEALQCAETKECLPWNWQVATAKAEVDRAQADFQLHSWASNGYSRDAQGRAWPNDPLVTWGSIRNIAAHYARVVTALVEHQRATGAAVVCIAP